MVIHPLPRDDMIAANGHDLLTASARALDAELDWLGRVIDVRLARQGTEPLPTPRDQGGGTSTYADFIHHYGLEADERLAVILGLAPHVRPEALDAFFTAPANSSRGRAAFGGLRGKLHGGFLPTGETFLFLLAGADLQRRFAGQRLFDRDHAFARHDLLRVETPPAGEPRFSGPLVMSEEMVDFLTLGTVRQPDFSTSFPARLLRTEMTWEELVLSPTTQEQLRELEAWIGYGRVLMDDWGMGRRLQPGYKCLFYGPPGTGKTLTATLLGGRVGMDVYRIDLSTIVSKYIGETEKNLERIFRRAEHMNCVLFFDEADALFGKRTSISDAHDRYANQEVSYLLQRIEDFPGLVILATNFKANLDDAFMRRFQAVVPFPMPTPAERARLWRAALPDRCTPEADLCLDDIAGRYELSGGSIMNVVRYASLMALHRGATMIRRTDVLGGIRRELQKDGKTL